MVTLLNHLSQSWTDSAIRSLDGLRRGFTDAYPVNEDPPPVTPYEVVYEGGKVRLRYYRAVGRPQATPLLIAFPLIKRPYVLDLMPGCSVIQNLTRQGFDVYLTDWQPPTRAESWRGVDVYVNNDLANAVRAIQIREGAPQVSMLGYCFGGLLATIYTALHPQTVKNLITLTLPLDMSVRELAFTNFMDHLRPRTLDLLLSVYGNCPAWVINSAFKAMGPVHTLLGKHIDLYRNGDRSGYGEMFERFEDWAGRDVPLAGQVCREVTQGIFQQNLLCQNRFQVGGRTVHLTDITCAVLNVVAEHDTIIHPTSSLPFAEAVDSVDAQNLLVPTGHMGVVVSGVAHKKLWPQVCAWLKERDGQLRH
ncbi:MAG: alpha/beta fold hydrolase [Candidatus Binatia bacterium]